MPDELTPGEFLTATNALASSLQLLLLDKVWTREAQLASSAATRDPARVADLSAVVDQMDTLLHECQDIAPELAAISTRTGNLLQTRYESLDATAIAAGASPDRIKQVFGRLQHHVNDRSKGSAALYLSQAAEFLSTRAAPEMEQIRAEFGRISAGDTSDGDMSEETQEAVGAVALGAGLMLGPEAAGAVIIVAQVVDCLT